jgi:hypothetical protein
VTKATGIAGDASVRAVIGSTDATVWPALALTGGILLALAAVGVIAFAHTWPTASRRYGAVKEAAEPIHNDADEHLNARDAAIDDWDELSRGDDPTDGLAEEQTDEPTEDDPPVR